MHLMMTTVGDLHADLWAGLTIRTRHVDGPDDVTVGDHPALGLCVVSHFGFEDRIEWFTQHPVTEAALWDLSEIQALLDTLDS